MLSIAVWCLVERRLGTDPWDPDTDDDGLTDGQEDKWVTDATGGTLSSVEVDATLDESFVEALRPTDPDSDDDGY